MMPVLKWAHDLSIDKWHGAACAKLQKARNSDTVISWKFCLLALITFCIIIIVCCLYRLTVAL